MELRPREPPSRLRPGEAEDSALGMRGVQGGAEVACRSAQDVTSDPSHGQACPSSGDAVGELAEGWGSPAPGSALAAERGQKPEASAGDVRRRPAAGVIRVTGGALSPGSELVAPAPASSGCRMHVGSPGRFGRGAQGGAHSQRWPGEGRRSPPTVGDLGRVLRACGWVAWQDQEKLASLDHTCPA